MADAAFDEANASDVSYPLLTFHRLDGILAHASTIDRREEASEAFIVTIRSRVLILDDVLGIIIDIVLNLVLDIILNLVLDTMRVNICDLITMASVNELAILSFSIDPMVINVVVLAVSWEELQPQAPDRTI